MAKANLLRWTKRAWGDFFGREEVPDLVVRCVGWAGMVVTEELPGGFLIEVQLAGHDGVVSECWAFP